MVLTPLGILPGSLTSPPTLRGHILMAGCSSDGFVYNRLRRLVSSWWGDFFTRLYRHELFPVEQGLVEQGLVAWRAEVMLDQHSCHSIRTTGHAQLLSGESRNGYSVHLHHHWSICVQHPLGMLSCSLVNQEIATLH